MNKDSVLFSLVGIGFGLFFGFGFASWANQRAAVAPGAAAGESQARSNAWANPEQLRAAAEEAARRARENQND